MGGFIVSDRYSATGTPYPDPATMCHECDGMGCYPVYGDTTEARDRQAWEDTHRTAHTFRARLRAARACSFLSPWKRLAILWERCDGCHFVKCPECKGTRRRGLTTP